MLTVQQLIDKAIEAGKPVSASTIQRHIRNRTIRASKKAGVYLISDTEAERWLEVWLESGESDDADLSDEVVVADFSDFFFSEVQPGKPTEVLRAGIFPDKNGKLVEITDADIDEFVINFNSGLAGQEVPVDVDHKKSEAAGWLTELRRVGDKLVASVDWNELGRQLVGDKVYRYVSAFIDMERKVIKSVSLVNFPAVKGLNPVELSDGVFALHPHIGMLEAITMQLQSIIDMLMPPMDDIEEEPMADLQEKTERGVAYPARCFLDRPDDESPSTWGLRICEEVAGDVDITRAQLGRAAAALGPAGFRGNRFEPKEGGKTVEQLKRDLVAEYRKLDVEDDDIPEHLFKESDEMAQELTDEQKAAMRAEIEAELREEIEAKTKEETELREAVEAELREEIETELRERMQVEAELRERVDGLCNGEGVALSMRPDDVMAVLKEPTADGVLTLLEAKLVDFSEKGSEGAGQSENGELKDVPAELAEALTAGELTLAEIHSRKNWSIVGPMLGADPAEAYQADLFKEYNFDNWK